MMSMFLTMSIVNDLYVIMMMHNLSFRERGNTLTLVVILVVAITMHAIC